MLRQTESAVLKVIQVWKESYGRAPSVRELSEALGKQAQLVRHYLHRLDRQGYIELTHDRHVLRIVPLYWE